MVLEVPAERPQAAAHAVGGVAHTARRVAQDALPVGPVVGNVAPDHLLDPPAPLDVEALADEARLEGRGRPRERAGPERGEGIVDGRGHVAERLEQRQEELLARVGAAIAERRHTLARRERREQVQDRGAAARRKAPGLREHGDAVDARPVERLEHGEGDGPRGDGRAGAGGRARVPEAIREAPRRLARRGRLDAEPGAVRDAHPGALERAVRAPAEVEDGRPHDAE